MKLVLFVVLVITIFPTDSRDAPDKPVSRSVKGNLDEDISSGLVASDSFEERKEEMRLDLRGNTGKKDIKTLMKNLGSLDKKLTKANSEMMQAIKEQGNITDINTKIKNITAKLESLKDGNTKLTQANSQMKIENEAIKKSLDTLKDGNTKLTQANSEINKSLVTLKDGNTKLTQANSQMKIENEAIKKSLDTLKDGNTKLTQANSQMKIDNQAIKKSLDSLKDGNTKLTQANSQMKIENQAIKKSLDTLKDGNTKLTQITSQMRIDILALKNVKGGVTIGGQVLTFSTERVTWAVAKTRCISLKGKLASLADPQAFNAYANSKYRGQHFWLGASDISREGTWTWINGKSLAGFPWPGNEPSNSGGNEDCLHWGHAYNYNDSTCTNAMRYVCEH